MTVTNESRLVFTVVETAELLGISRTHAYELVARDAARRPKLHETNRATRSSPRDS